MATWGGEKSCSSVREHVTAGAKLGPSSSDCPRPQNETLRAPRAQRQRTHPVGGRASIKPGGGREEEGGLK